MAPNMMTIRPMAAGCARTPEITPRAPAISAAPGKMVKGLVMPRLLLRPSGSLRWLEPPVRKMRPTMKRRMRRARSENWASWGKVMGFLRTRDSRQPANEWESVARFGGKFNREQSLGVRRRVRWQLAEGEGMTMGGARR